MRAVKVAKSLPLTLNQEYFQPMISVCMINISTNDF